MPGARSPAALNSHHQVVALKYRPKNFEALIGQDHIAVALGKAIEQNKVGHAYLFTGARGVGKTSSARIFAKCLNCEKGPTAQPCGKCDICQSISRGDDVDVLEIDGASNNGVDQIRTLRANAAIRPGRARNKIYIIDEVHMLSKSAFNALLKTLEEPPAHVKFIFCTTEPEKIPITVLSRCQRFDFSPVQTSEIADSLKKIAAQENVKIGDDAVALLARRANGSMRDSQSLLEQLLSFCDDKITVDDVHKLVGTADVGRIADLAAAITDKNPQTSLAQINDAITKGVDAGQLAEQLLGYFRDVMATKVGCGEDILLTCSTADLKPLGEIAQQLGLETILSGVQVLDAALVKMEKSLHARTLLEMAVIRMCHLENLDSISDLIQQLSQAGQSGGSANRTPVRPAPRNVELKKVTPSDPSKKKDLTETPPAKSAPLDSGTKNAAASVTPAPTVRQAESSETNFPGSTNTLAVAETASNRSHPATATAVAAKPDSQNGKRLSEANPIASSEIESLWKKTLESIEDLTGELASNYESIELKGAEQLTVTLKNAYNTHECNKPERKQTIESALAKIAGRGYRLEFITSKIVQPTEQAADAPLSRVQQIRKLNENAFVKQATSLFDAEIISFYPSRKK